MHTCMYTHTHTHTHGHTPFMWRSESLLLHTHTHHTPTHTHKHTQAHPLDVEEMGVCYHCKYSHCVMADDVLNAHPQIVHSPHSEWESLRHWGFLETTFRFYQAAFVHGLSSVSLPLLLDRSRVVVCSFSLLDHFSPKKIS